MPDTESRIREIRDELAAIAPVPDQGDVSPLVLAKHMTVSAQHRWTAEMTKTTDELDFKNLAAMVAEFAAATALYALGDTGSPELDLGVSPPLVPDVLRGKTPAEVATFIRDAEEDGGSLGEWLFDYLGKELHEQVTGLVDELVKLNAEAKATKKAQAAEAVSPGA